MSTFVQVFCVWQALVALWVGLIQLAHSLCLCESSVGGLGETEDRDREREGHTERDNTLLVVGVGGEVKVSRYIGNTYFIL